jgi:hypothetical protein
MLSPLTYKHNDEHNSNRSHCRHFFLVYCMYVCMYVLPGGTYSMYSKEDVFRLVHSPSVLYERNMQIFIYEYI